MNETIQAHAFSMHQLRNHFMDVIDLFPRSIVQGEIELKLRNQLLLHCEEVLHNPEANPDASTRLAGQLSQQRELNAKQPAVRELCESVLLEGCERWIRHVIDQQPPQGRGPWVPGRYQLRLIDIWLNCQMEGDYNPMHTHGGSFSGVVFLKVPSQINGSSFDGQLCFHGPEEYHLQSFRTGMTKYVLPSQGDFYIFPAWQPHSVMPFRGSGERWSLAFNVVAQPTSGHPQPPEQNQNISLSSQRPRARGF